MKTCPSCFILHAPLSCPKFLKVEELVAAYKREDPMSSVPCGDPADGITCADSFRRHLLSWLDEDPNRELPKHWYTKTRSP